MNGGVLVVGDLLDDVVVRPAAPLARGTDTPAAIVRAAGGSAANTAAWLAAEGVPVRFAARVGAADAARHTAELTHAGVEAHLASDAVFPTGSVVTIVERDGERSFYTDRGAAARLDARDLPHGLLDGVALLYLSAYALASEPSRDAVLALCEAARARGCGVAVDPNSSALLRALGADRFLCWTAGAMLFANADEAALLTGTGDPAAQLTFLASRYELAVVTRGADGADAACGADRRHVDALAADAIDTTGAGDAFAAGFLAAHRRGAELDAALHGGAAAGAHAVTRIGGRPPADRSALGTP